LFCRINSFFGGWRARWDLNPGPPAPQAGVIIRTRRQAPFMCPQKSEGRVVNTLLELKNSGSKKARDGVKVSSFLVHVVARL
jgi:hypothetical protein